MFNKYLNIPPPENREVYEIMHKTSVELETAQMAI